MKFLGNVSLSVVESMETWDGLAILAGPGEVLRARDCLLAAHSHSFVVHRLTRGLWESESIVIILDILLP